MMLKLFIVFLACLMAASLQSCASVDVKRMTYKALRQHDCRLNEPNAFCERGYSNEYLQYERLRQEFLRNKQQNRQVFAQNTIEEVPTNIW